MVGSVFLDQEDHPRIRGEHRCRTAVCRPPWGSSPHTRGALAAAAACLRASVDHPRIRGEHLPWTFKQG